MTGRCTLIVLLAVGVLPLFAEAPLPLPKDTLPVKLALDSVPLGLEARIVPKDNPLTESRVALGRRLFFDPILSGDRTVSCATCHRPDQGFASGEARPRGVRGQLAERHAPSLFNRAYATSMFWDGRSASLEDQALKPIENPVEMGSSVPEAVKRLSDDKDYRTQFAAAFPDGVTSANLAKALAGFERTLLRGDSKVDQFRMKGKHDALNPEERHGLWIYESKGRCWSCHSGANFTDEGFHNTGVGWGETPPDFGRFLVTKKEGDRGRFKTPTLRGVSLTAPYMHDGSIKTLEEVMAYYSKGGNKNPHLDSKMEPLNLSETEIRALVAFLKTL